MRFLVSLAAIVLIVAGGLYIWQFTKEIQTRAAREKAANERTLKTLDSRTELFKLTGASDADTSKAVAFCRETRDRQDIKGSAYANSILGYCRDVGFPH